MTVAFSLRVSTEEQRERQSITTENDFALRYCALRQLQIHQTYSDDGVSGTVPVEVRPVGRRLLEDAQLHKFNQLLIFKLDRLGRDTRLILKTVAELEKHGVRVRSMTEEFDPGQKVKIYWVSVNADCAFIATCTGMRAGYKIAFSEGLSLPAACSRKQGLPFRKG